MIFLEIEDFEKQVRGEVLSVVTSEQSAILDEGELAAIGEMSSYLAKKYDTTEIFSQVAEARNRLIIMYLIDILLYHIHSRINPQKVPELRGIRYDAAIAWLKLVAKGEILPDLPLLQEQSGDNVLYGSNEKRNLHF